MIQQSLSTALPDAALPTAKICTVPVQRGTVNQATDTDIMDNDDKNITHTYCTQIDRVYYIVEVFCPTLSFPQYSIY